MVLANDRQRRAGRNADARNAQLSSLSQPAAPGEPRVGTDRRGGRAAGIMWSRVRGWGGAAGGSCGVAVRVLAGREVVGVARQQRSPCRYRRLPTTLPRRWWWWGGGFAVTGPCPRQGCCLWRDRCARLPGESRSGSPQVGPGPPRPMPRGQVDSVGLRVAGLVFQRLSAVTLCLDRADEVRGARPVFSVPPSAALVPGAAGVKPARAGSRAGPSPCVLWGQCATDTGGQKSWESEARKRRVVWFEFLP